jgi:hypothetical protein
LQTPATWKEVSERLRHGSEKSSSGMKLNVSDGVVRSFNFVMDVKLSAY